MKIVASLAAVLAAGMFMTGSLPAMTPTPAVKPVTASALKQEVVKRKGKVVLVNLWATWCPPCVASYPGIVSLSRKYKARGLEVVSVSVDDPKNLKGKVQPFLRKQRPNFATFIKAPGDDEAFIRAVDPKWQGDLPADFLIGPDGKKMESLTGKNDLSKLETLVKQQLARIQGVQKRASR